MSTEGPAWKAEPKSAVLNAVIDSEKFRGVRWTPTTDAVMEAVGPHIKAAEERGRREAAAFLRSPWRAGGFASGERAAILEAADLIDPDKQ